MNTLSTYIMFLAFIGVPAIAYIPKLIEGLFAMLRMSSAMMGTPWP